MSERFNYLNYLVLFYGVITGIVKVKIVIPKNVSSNLIIAQAAKTIKSPTKAAESARKTLTYAILGLVLIIAAWFILKFLSEFTGVDLTEFTFSVP